MDLLQILMRPPIGHPALRIAVVVSAWDLVETLQDKGGVPRLAPREWLRTELPLLDQFLSSNADAIVFRVFGVSAQGGDYGDTTVVDGLQGVNPAERVRVVDETAIGNDLTILLDWLELGG